MRFQWRDCPACDKRKTTNSFEIPSRDGGPQKYREMCNICFNTQYTPLHSGFTNNRTYLKYGLRINGRVCRKRGFHVMRKSG